MLEFRLPRDLKKKKIRLAFKENIEPQETFLDSLAQKKEAEFGLSEKRFETPLSRNVLLGFLIFIFCLLAFLFLQNLSVSGNSRQRVVSAGGSQ